MERIIEELIAVIAKEIEAFDELLQTLRKKQRAVVEGAVERLNKSVEEEGKLANQTKALEAERIERTQKLAQELEMENANPKLSEIIEKVEEKYAQRLTEQRELLRSVVQNIQNLNKSNQYLLNYSLNHIEKSMQILLSGHDAVSVYRKDGTVQQGVTKNQLLDQSI
ncbi:flagellar protein FlgN [bacterium]|nr:flagellar protein FlgN [bacterium]